MKQSNIPDKLESLIKSELDQSVNNLDAATVSKLNQARQKAIDNASRNRYQQWLIPAGSFAVAALVLAMQTSHFFTPASPINPQSEVLGDLEILASSQDLDFYENLEFYAWLDEELQQAG